MAEASGVNVNTVRAVYQRLEQRGLIESQPGQRHVRRPPRCAAPRPWARSPPTPPARPRRPASIRARSPPRSTWPPMPRTLAGERGSERRRGCGRRPSALERTPGNSKRRRRDRRRGRGERRGARAQARAASPDRRAGAGDRRDRSRTPRPRATSKRRPAGAAGTAAALASARPDVAERRSEPRAGPLRARAPPARRRRARLDERAAASGSAGRAGTGETASPSRRRPRARGDRRIGHAVAAGRRPPTVPAKTVVRTARRRPRAAHRSCPGAPARVAGSAACDRALAVGVLGEHRLGASDPPGLHVEGSVLGIAEDRARRYPRPVRSRGEAAGYARSGTRSRAMSTFGSNAIASRWQAGGRPPTSTVVSCSPATTCALVTTIVRAARPSPSPRSPGRRRCRARARRCARPRARPARGRSAAAARRRPGRGRRAAAAGPGARARSGSGPRAAADWLSSRRTAERWMSARSCSCAGRLRRHRGEDPDDAQAERRAERRAEQTVEQAERPGRTGCAPQPEPQALKPARQDRAGEQRADQPERGRIRRGRPAGQQKRTQASSEECT